MSRLASGFWVRAYLKRLELENIPPMSPRMAMMRRGPCW